MAAEREIKRDESIPFGDVDLVHPALKVGGISLPGS